MTHLQIAIAVYLVGYVVSYTWIRSLCRKRNGGWTKSERRKTLLLSLFSGVTVIVIAGTLIEEKWVGNQDDDASW